MNIQSKNAVKHPLQIILQQENFDCEAHNGPGKCLQVTLVKERGLGPMFAAVLNEVRFQAEFGVELRVADAFEQMRTHAFGTDVVVLFPSVCYVWDVEAEP